MLNKLLSLIWIAIDGGPCGGKTTALAKITKALERIGMLCVVVPEAATELINEGIKPSVIGFVEFQRLVIKRQLKNEAAAARKAKRLMKKHGKQCVIITDRGLLSGAAYLPGENRLSDFAAILAEFGLTVEGVRSHYAGVIHLVTAADGALEFYTCENNSARTETPELARERDLKTKQAWLGHQHLCIVANRNPDGTKISFKAKERKAVREVFRILGYPVPIEDEKRYEVAPFKPAKFPVPYEAVDIEQQYLVSSGPKTEERVRVRTWLGESTYYYTKKWPNRSGADNEIEYLVSKKKMLELLKRADPQSQPIKKRRHYFVWKNQYFEADIFKGRHAGKFRLEREKTKRNDKTTIPPFITVIRDITNDKSERNRALARAA
ncbi:MAG TPA: AAA family ATPase [Candidatus Paceibacterota bacterium]|nr:AAA family ATPase [Candidatus Paceibacterota bacterium]